MVLLKGGARGALSLPPRRRVVPPHRRNRNPSWSALVPDASYAGVRYHRFSVRREGCCSFCLRPHSPPVARIPTSDWSGWVLALRQAEKSSIGCPVMIINPGPHVAHSKSCSGVPTGHTHQYRLRHSTQITSAVRCGLFSSRSVSLPMSNSELLRNP